MVAVYLQGYGLLQKNDNLHPERVSVPSSHWRLIQIKQATGRLGTVEQASFTENYLVSQLLIFNRQICMMYICRMYLAKRQLHTQKKRFRSSGVESACCEFYACLQFLKWTASP